MFFPGDFPGSKQTRYRNGAEFIRNRRSVASAVDNQLQTFIDFSVVEGNTDLFGKRLVAGAMVFSYGLGLAATNCLNSFSYGYDRLRFIKPVFIGDTIYTIRENLSKEPKDDRMGKVRVSYSIYKGKGELVLYCEHLMTALYRDPAGASDV